MRKHIKMDHPYSPDQRAFTLVEILVSIAVLVLMIVMVAQLTSNASKATSASTKQVAADVQAQLVFSQMQNDFDGMSKDKAQDDFFWKNNGTGTNNGANDVFFFYAEAIGFYFGNADASNPYNQAPSGVVGYRVNNLTTWSGSYPQTTYPNQCLYRVGKGLIWEGNISDVASAEGPVFLTFPKGYATPDPKVTFRDRTAADTCAI